MVLNAFSGPSPLFPVLSSPVLFYAFHFLTKLGDLKKKMSDEKEEMNESRRFQMHL